MRTAACLPQAPDTAVYLLQAPDRASLTARLARLADVAPWLSDAELHDLACQLAREASGNEQVRVAVVASRQEQLARLAGEATMLLPDLAAGALAIRPGIFAADGAAGRVTLLLSDGSAGMASRHEQPADAAGQPSADATGQPPADTAGQPPADAAGQLPSLAWLAWLDQVGVRVGTAVGRGLGEIAGLVWAGCLPEAEATRLARRCGEILSRPCGCAAAQEERSAQLRALLTQFVFTGPRRRLISAATGRALISASDIVEALCAQLGSQDRLEEALRAGAADADLLIEAGPGESLSAAAARFGQVPAISLVAGAGHDRAAAGAVAALFAVGVLGRPRALHAGQAARPIDIWRERIFIASPCQAPSPGPAGSSPGTPQAGMRPGGTPQAGRLPGTTPSAAAAPMAGRALPTAADAKWVPAATPAAAPATAGPGAGRAGSQERHADLEAGPAEPAPRSPGPTLQPPRPGGDRPAAGPSSAPHPPAAGPSSAPDPAAGPGSAPGPAAPDDDPVAGIGPWTRCFAEQLQPPRQPVIPGDDKLWRVTVAPNHPLRKLVDDLFPDEPGAGRALAVIGDPDDPDACAAALSAVADAISTGQLVVISNGPAFSGFWASLHAEHPFLGITLLRVPEGAEGLRAARRYAASGPGQFRELVIDATGQPREPVVAPVELSGGGAFPLGRTDVVLVSRGANGAGLALAQVIACCGAPVAVVGRAGPDEDSEVMNGLEQLRWAGARIAYEAVDVADPADMAAALERIERMFGPVTAIAHAIKAGRPRLVSELTETELCAHVAAESAGLRNLVSSIRTDRLRLIVTFGSVAGRHGMAGRSLLALSSGHLAARAQRLSDAIGGCQALHVDWPGWSGAGLGEPADLATGLARAGIMPIPVSEGSRMLLRMLTTPELPARVAVHGRIGVPAPSAVGHAAPQPPAAAAKHGRFVEVMRVHYPGVELVCEARLSLRADPYLADHQVDGIPVLPAAMALEAMAQAATALAGRPVRRATGVSMIAPVVVPANDPDSQAVIRICALRDGDTVRTAVRCADSGFVVDHFLATFRDHPDEPGMAGLPSEPGEPTFAESPATHVGSAGITDGTELYGPVFFQSGRFQRVAFLPEVTSRTCRALARGGDDQPWFGSAVDLAGGPLVLGSPGLNDAALQVPQACVPHRRLLVAGCEAVSFSGRETDGAVEIRAVAVTPAGRLAHESPAAADRAAGDRAAGDRAAGDRAAGDHAAGKPAAAQAEAPACNAAPSSPQPVPQPRSAGRPVAQALALPAEYAWDVEAVDAAGNLLASWRGLRMIDAGPLPRRAAWPPSLLSVYLERSAASRGLGDGIRVSVQCGQPESALAPSPVVAVVPRPAQSPDEAARPASPGSGTAASRGSGAAASRGSGAAAISSGSGCLGGFTLRIEAGDSAVCSWHAADPAQAGPAADPRLAGLRAELARRFGEPLATLNARLRAIAACLPAPDPPASHLVIDEPAGEGWVVLRAGDAVIACTAAKISGVPLPVAIAMATGGSGGDAGAAGERDQRSGEPDRRPAERDRRPAERGRQRGNPAGTGVRTR
jgi:enediyne polyketide synthase